MCPNAGGVPPPAFVAAQQLPFPAPGRQALPLPLPGPGPNANGAAGPNQAPVAGANGAAPAGLPAPGDQDPGVSLLLPFALGMIAELVGLLGLPWSLFFCFQ